MDRADRIGSVSSLTEYAAVGQNGHLKWNPGKWSPCGLISTSTYYDSFSKDIYFWNGKGGP